MKDDNLKSGAERRQYPRVRKNFILTYSRQDDPAKKQTEITQLKNISLGGMCFVATHTFPVGTRLDVELRTPYLSDKAHLKGHILESREKVVGLMYETRLQFDGLDSEAEFLLKNLIEFFLKEGKDGDEQD